MRFLKVSSLSITLNPPTYWPCNTSLTQLKLESGTSSCLSVELSKLASIFFNIYDTVSIILNLVAAD